MQSRCFIREVFWFWLGAIQVFGFIRQVFMFWLGVVQMFSFIKKVFLFWMGAVQLLILGDRCSCLDWLQSRCLVLSEQVHWKDWFYYEFSSPVWLSALAKTLFKWIWSTFRNLHHGKRKILWTFDISFFKCYDSLLVYAWKSRLWYKDNTFLLKCILSQSQVIGTIFDSD